MSRKNTIEDFFANIDTRGGDNEQCWPWIGHASTVHKDRGYFSFEGKRWLVYRLMYYLVYGNIPEEDAEGRQIVVRHKCDNSLCCNPVHLVLGTRAENEQDKYLNDRAGLPVAVVREIKRLLQTTQWSQEQIAKFVTERYNYQVSRSAVRDIKNGFRRTNIDQAKTMEEQYGSGNISCDDCTPVRDDLAGDS
jgi:hypothetical protein